MRIGYYGISGNLSLFTSLIRQEGNVQDIVNSFIVDIQSGAMLFEGFLGCRNWN